MAPCIGGAYFIRDFCFIASQHQYTLKAGEGLKDSDAHLLTSTLFLKLDAFYTNKIRLPVIYHREEPYFDAGEPLNVITSGRIVRTITNQFGIIENGPTGCMCCLVKREGAFGPLFLGDYFTFRLVKHIGLTSGALALCA